jgi:hypothetical protein
MQGIGNDTLLNFGLKDVRCSGVVGNFMNLKSLLIIITAFLISFLNIEIKQIRRWGATIGVFLFVCLTVYAVDHKAFLYFPIIRGVVWLETIRLSFERLFGWGMGTFSITFNQIAHIGVARAEGLWLTPHNCWLQILFETGIIGFTLVLLYTVDLFHRLKEKGLYSLIIGLSFICLDMMVHFPTRNTPTVLLIICYLAFCENRIKESL